MAPHWVDASLLPGPPALQGQPRPASPRGLHCEVAKLLQGPGGVLASPSWAAPTTGRPGAARWLWTGGRGCWPSSSSSSRCGVRTGKVEEMGHPGGCPEARPQRPSTRLPRETALCASAAGNPTRGLTHTGSSTTRGPSSCAREFVSQAAEKEELNFIFLTFKYKMRANIQLTCLINFKYVCHHLDIGIYFFNCKSYEI